MEYSKIIAITGLPGLFELISSKSDGGIVRSLEDKITKFVSSRVHQFSHLESIEVYTTRHNVNLVDVLKAMESSKENLPDDKDASSLKSYFEKIFPDLDFERVYTSDLKKMVKWYSVLAKNGVDIKLSEPAVEEVDAQEEEAAHIPDVKAKKPEKTMAPDKTEAIKAEEKKPAKKTAEPKAAEVKPAKKESAKKEVVEENPAKKTTPKKKTPEKEEKKSAVKPAEKKPAAKKK